MTITEHISDARLDRYARRESDMWEILRVQPHLASCDGCRRKLAQIMDAEKAFAAIQQNFALDETTDEPEHLTYEQLEFFADSRLDAVDREIAESHLAFCGECERDLNDLLKYREIAQTAPAAANTVLAESPKTSFWSKLFAFDSISALAPVAAVLLVVAFVGAWFLLRGGGTNEIAQSNNSQNAPVANFNSAVNVPANNVPANDVSPETSFSPSPQVSPSPAENVPEKETLYALDDGNLKVDEKGNLQGAENLSPATRDLIKQSLQSGKVSISNNLPGGAGGILMSENNAESGVPFALRTPVGKVIRESQPVLSWKPLKNAESYSVAIVDEKFRVVESSGKLTATAWKPAKPLPRGANYSWQVTATLADGTQTVSPSAPAPQARFRVLEQNLADEISRLEKSQNGSPLALGVLYAKAGLRREARAEFGKLVRQNPDSKLARRLLQSVK